MMLSASPPRRPFEALPKHALPDSPFDDPFAVTAQPRVDVKMTFARTRMAGRRGSLRGLWNPLIDFINENRLQLLLSILVGLFGIIMMLVIAYTFFASGHTAQPLVAPLPTFAPIVSVTPNVTATPLPNVTPIAVAAMRPEPTAEPIALPKWLNSDCIYRMQVVIEGETGGIDDQLTVDFVASQVLYTALYSQCGYGSSVKGSIENLWQGWKRYANTGTAVILSMRTSNALDHALFNLSRPLFPQCLYTGSAADVFGVWLKYDKSLSIDVALPAYPKAPLVYGIDCPQGK